MSRAAISILDALELFGQHGGLDLVAALLAPEVRLVGRERAVLVIGRGDHLLDTRGKRTRKDGLDAKAIMR